jgi:hypothetical protein
MKLAKQRNDGSRAGRQRNQEGRLENYREERPLVAEPWPTREPAPETPKSAQPEGQTI